MKEARLAVMKFLEGAPLTTSEVILRPCGLPLKLSPGIVSALLAGSTGDIRMVLTIMNASRALSFGKECDVTSITKALDKGESYDSLVADMTLHTSSFWHANGFQ